MRKIRLMWAMFSTDLMLLSRERIYRTALGGYVVILATLYWLWYGEFAAIDGVSVQLRMVFSQRVLLAQWVLTSALTPWVVLRLAGHADLDALVRSIAASAQAPWRALLGKIGALSVYLGLAMLASLPLVMLTYLVGMSTARDVLRGYGSLGGWLLLAQLSTLAWCLYVTSPLVALCLAYLTLLGLGMAYGQLVASAGSGLAALSAAGLAVLLGLLLLYRCRRRLVYFQG